jgi:protein phosphatase
MVASGMMTEEEAETSPDRNKVLRSLGSVRHRQDNYVDGLNAVMEENTLDLAPGEAIVMVSDGVWGEVKDARIAEILEANLADPQAVADVLVAEALEAGAPDNATALVVMRVA